MVSRRFTTAVQLSAEIMQQRTYEVSWFGGCFAFTKIKKQPRLKFRCSDMQSCRAVMVTVLNLHSSCKFYQASLTRSNDFL